MNYLAMLGVFVAMIGGKYALARRYPDASHELPMIVMTWGLMVFVGVVVWLAFA